MKTTTWITLVFSVCLTGAVSAAKPDKTRTRPGSPVPLAEELKLFDKDGNGRLDEGEAALVQKTFAALSKIDKNANGAIDANELPGPRTRAVKTDRSRRGGVFSSADKNANRRIDPEEVEALQKALAVADSPLMKKLDRNSNGNLDADEVARLNERLEKFQRGTPANRRKPAAAAPAKTPPGPSAAAAEKPAESTAKTGAVAEPPKKTETQPAPAAK